MALQSTINNLKDMLSRISQDLVKAEHGNKAAAQRVRTTTVRLEKLAKAYRKESIQSEKSVRGGKRPAPRKAAARPHTKAPARPAATKLKARPKTRASLAKPRSLAIKRPTAKLPLRRGR